MEQVQIYNSEYNGSHTVDAASGAYIWINGLRCLDLSMGGGSLIFGHSPSFVMAEVRKQLKYGTLYCHPNRLAKNFAKRFGELTGWDSIVLCNTGTEANMRAMRLARAFTGRNRIAILPGSWHGSSDLTLWKDYPSGVDKPDVVLLDKSTNYKKLAMVLVEPHQNSKPTINNEELSSIRKKCDLSKTLLCFDEVLTGLRVGRKYCDIQPDLSTYGKVFGGGFPIGIVAGKREIMQCALTGVFMGGTFSANPISMVAGLATMNHVDNLMLKKLENKSNWLKWTINRSCSRVRVDGVGCILKLRLPDLSKQNKFLSYLRSNLVHINPNRLIAVSTKHTCKDIEVVARIIKRAETVCQM